jgi:hypothetical protein
MRHWKRFRSYVRHQTEREHEWIGQNPMAFKLVVLFLASGLALAGAGLLVLTHDRGCRGDQWWAGASTAFTWIGCSLGGVWWAERTTRN